MASHFRLGKYIAQNAIAVSSTNSYATDAVHILNLDNIYMQMNITGTPVGSISIQVSGDHTEDELGNILVPGNWIEILAIPVTGPINIGQDLNQLGAPYLRIVYTNASSSGVISTFISGKGLI